MRGALLAAAASCLGGCFMLLVGGAGAEGGYVAAQKGRSSGETVGDQWIHAKVSSSLISHSKVKKRDIDVDVFKGVVTLRGEVSSVEERDTAVSLARAVRGVVKVLDLLVVGKR